MCWTGCSPFRYLQGESLAVADLSLDISLTKEWTLTRFAAAFALAMTGACGGDDAGDADAAPATDGGGGDAGLGDAAVVDCSGDHRESADNANNPFPPGNGSAERTGLGLTAGGDGFWVCGELDPEQSNEQFADYDSFEFNIEGDDAVDLRIELVASGSSETSMGLDLFRVDDGPPVPVASAPFRRDHALIAGLIAQPGRYWVSAVAWPPAPEGPIGYAISVRENALSCPAAEPPPIFTESADGPDQRGNDTVAVEPPQPPVLTEAKADAPEATGLVLEPDVVALVRGTSEIAESAGDAYLDRDTFLIETGPATTELELRMSWEDGDVDLDLYLFEAGDPTIDYSAGLGVSTSGNRDETLTVNVDPGRAYWLWVAAFDNSSQGGATDLPRDYDLTFCPREHVSPAPPR